jgi:hypothetical protein
MPSLRPSTRCCAPSIRLCGSRARATCCTDAHSTSPASRASCAHRPFASLVRCPAVPGSQRLTVAAQALHASCTGARTTALAAVAVCSASMRFPQPQTLWASRVCRLRQRLGCSARRRLPSSASSTSKRMQTVRALSFADDDEDTAMMMVVMPTRSVAHRVANSSRTAPEEKDCAGRRAARVQRPGGNMIPCDTDVLM